MKFLSRIGHWLFYFTVRIATSFRYKIEVRGLDKIRGKGILFLPNHPAEMDPIIMMQTLWPRFAPKPMAVEHFYYQKGLRFFMELVRALPLPTMDRANKWKERRVAKLKETILQQLDAGENFLIYPSGKLKGTPDEKIGGASLIGDLLNMRPEMQVALVRTTGLWGSMFSKALTGSAPDFGKCMWKGIKIVLKNGIFFVPKRKVIVEVEWAPVGFPRMASRLDLNRWLENWYNQREDALKLVSYAFWKEELPEVVVPEQKQVELNVPDEVRDEIYRVIAKMSGRSSESMDPTLHLSHDLGLDSIDVSQLYVLLEERYDAEEHTPGSLETVGDILNAAVGGKDEERETVEEKKKKWPNEPPRPEVMIGEGKTIPEVFLRNCDRMGNAIACADGMAGVLSYKKFKRAALVLSQKIREMPGEQIGVMLPSSVGAYVVIMSCYLAGKTPVMLNWTAGYRSLEHSIEMTGIEVVLTSFRFLSRLDNGDFGKVDDLLVLLEDVRRDITLKEKLKGAFRSLQKADSLMKKLSLDTNSESNAVIIFTSGTESLPKGVPLTHNNILENQRSALKAIEIRGSDTLYGVLPPFHSFGFSVTGLLPLLSGLRVCYYADPTDSRALANDVDHYEPTIFCCAPTFIQGMFRVGSKEQLSSLRLVVTGAEKAPQELVEQVGEDRLMEGYGITECSPIVTLERQGESHKGVGRAISGIDLCTIDAKTEKRLPDGVEGEVCIRGPNVFNGYLGNPRNPFVELDKSRWYRSGDRGKIDSDGTLILTGRLKRFVKIGGEMVSLGGLEEDILSICSDRGWSPKKIEAPVLAVVAKGSESEKPQIIVYATFDLNRESINTALREKGMGRLVKIASIERLKEIPLTGTGKIAYRQLEENA